VDFIAMDIKTSPEKYPIATGLKNSWKNAGKTLKYIIKSGINHCFRTTAVPGITDEEDFREIAKLIKGAKLYVIQQFENDITLDESMKDTKPYTEKELAVFTAIAEKSGVSVKVENLAVTA